MGEDLNELLEQLDNSTQGLVDFMDTGYEHLSYVNKDNLFYKVFKAKKKLDQISAETTRRFKETK